MKKVKKAFFLFIFMITALTLAACSGSRSNAEIPVAMEGKVPVAPVARSLRPYRIQVGDVLQVSLLLNPELTEEVAVRPDGLISTAVVQDVQTYGKTAGELQKELKSAYKKHLTDPELTVVVKSFAPSRVYVLGQVASPGEMVSVGPNMTLLQAIARAGGMLNSGDEKNILIFRRGAGEEPEVFRADYSAATDGSPSKDIRLAAYDVVFVPRTGVADAYKSFQQNVQQFLPTSFGFGYTMR